MTLRPLTPKEFSRLVGGLRSERWVREECARFVAAKRKAVRRGEPVDPATLPGLETVRDSVPYLISPRALERFRPSVAEFIA